MFEKDSNNQKLHSRRT